MVRIFFENPDLHGHLIDHEIGAFRSIAVAERQGYSPWALVRLDRFDLSAQRI